MNLFKRTPKAANLEMECRKCHKPMKRFKFFSMFQSALCGKCNAEYKKYNKVFDKLHSKFTDECFSKRGEVFYRFLQDQKPKDVKVVLKVQYSEPEH